MRRVTVAVMRIPGEDPIKEIEARVGHRAASDDKAATVDPGAEPHARHCGGRDVVPGPSLGIDLSINGAHDCTILGTTGQVAQRFTVDSSETGMRKVEHHVIRRSSTPWTTRRRHPRGWIG